MQELAPKIEGRSMGEKETKAFLAKHGAVQLFFEDWVPGEPIIVVFTENILDSMNEYQDRRTTREIPKNKMPCLIRMDRPARMYLSGTSGNSFALENDGGQIDYFTINSQTEEISWVKSSANFRGALDPYRAAAGNLFRSLDELFPKQPMPIKSQEK